jgi:hypothetical protein
MTRKTRRNVNKVLTIPVLRRSFENFEAFVKSKIQGRDSKDKIIKDICKEWHKIFGKKLSHISAKEYVEEFMSSQKKLGHKKIRRSQDGGSAVTGAPLDYNLRQGMYLEPGSVPLANSSLPLTGGRESNFGSFTPYVSSVMQPPDIAQKMDPVIGQSQWPMPLAGSGSNAFMKGGKRSSRKLRRGGGITPASLLRAFDVSTPHNGITNFRDTFNGKIVGLPSDQSTIPAPMYRSLNRI